jgi:hypothetical protein
MIEAYTSEEVVDHCTNYIRYRTVIGVSVSQHKGRTLGRRYTRKELLIDKDYQTMRQAHHSVLHRLVFLEPYIEKQMNEISAASDGHIEEWVLKQHKLCFTTWMKDQNIPNRESAEFIKSLASSPCSQVTS